MLTQFGNNPKKFISWDVQTGVLVSAIISPEKQGTPQHHSVTYSASGTVFGVLFHNAHTSTIHTYNVLLGAHIYSHSIESPALDRIWTHGEHLQFATLNHGTITTWEVGFTSTHMLAEVESLSIPDNFDSHGVLFHPTPSQLAFIAEGRILVWDAQNSKFLLDCIDVERPVWMSFSPDGYIFTCGTTNYAIHLWKRTPTGYTFHQKFISNTWAPIPLISPNGMSIITFCSSVIQLWHTTDSTSHSTSSTQALQRGKNIFILEFSPNKTSAVVARMEDETVTVLDLKSGISWLVIDTNMKVHGLRVGDGNIIVVGDGKIVTWDMPVGDHIPNLRANIDNSVQTITFDHPPFSTFTSRPTISVSPDLNHIVVVEPDEVRFGGSCLCLYNVHTGQCLGSTPVKFGTSPWLTPDGQNVWCVEDCNKADGWKVVRDGKSDVVNLVHLGLTIHQPDGSPWQSSHGHQVTDDQWILSSSGERLFWLPPHWRSHWWHRMWSGQFLVLSHRELSEVVILELE